MKILFVHNNFPAQFRTLVSALSRAEDIEIAAIGCESAKSMLAVALYRYPTPPALANAHSFARRFDNECRRAEEVLYAATKLSGDGFEPDLIFVHPGWGENIPLPAVFPKAKIIVYCEYYYRSAGGDIGFDPEFSHMGIDGFVGLETRNAATILALVAGEVGLSPTQWQKSTYPTDFQKKISVIHEGVDTDLFAPNPEASFTLPDGTILTAEDEILTYSARNLEPIRGFHSFMRALPKILEKRSKVKVLIIGGDGVSYGAAPRKHPTWKAALLHELEGKIDLRRVVFLGPLPYSDYLKILQISATHVYLTYPFVLSWSMLEAMSVGCLLVASDTPPVREIIDGANGVLAPMLDSNALAEKITEALTNRQALQPLRDAARRTVQERYDARRVCLPEYLSLIRQVTGKEIILKKNVETALL